jgi:squalene synthase HpnC
MIVATSANSDPHPERSSMRAGGAAFASALNAGLSVEHPAVTLRDAYAWCARLAHSHYENFTIASWLMPRAMRPSMHAIYAYARIADDFADEEHDPAKLDEWEHELELAYAGTPRHPVFIALADTVRRFDIPREPFANLLTAFRSDLAFKGFDTLDDLLDYARYSANPVGRLVLYLFGYRDAERQRLSDMICTGLQLANFWQDIAVDLAKDRVYLPRHDLMRFEVTVDDLRAAHITPGFVALLRHESSVARELLERGSALAYTVDRHLMRDVLMFAGGGLAILRAIARVNYDVFRQRPRLGKFGYARLGWDSFRGRVRV